VRFSFHHPQPFATPHSYTLVLETRPSLSNTLCLPSSSFLHGSFVLPKPSSLPTYRLPLPLAAHVPVKWLWVLHDIDIVHSLTARKSYASSGGSPRSCILWMLDYFVLRRNSIVGIWTPAVGQPGHRIRKPPCIQSHTCQCPDSVRKN
jgi:hypothetical protein